MSKPKIKYYENFNGGETMEALFKKPLESYGIKEGDKTSVYIQRMKYIDGIMLYPKFGVPNFYISVKTEDDVFEWFDLTGDTTLHHL